MPTNPLVQQGTLNRLRCSVVVPSETTLNITSSYMGSSFASVSFSEPFAELIGTATGAVTSPEPYVFGTISVGVLKTQALAAQWVSQAQTESAIGQVTIYPDSASYPATTLDNCVIQSIEPAAFDGKDPVVRVTLRGVYYLNSDLWSVL